MAIWLELEFISLNYSLNSLLINHNHLKLLVMSQPPSTTLSTFKIPILLINSTIQLRNMRRSLYICSSRYSVIPQLRQS